MNRNLWIVCVLLLLSSLVGAEPEQRVMKYLAVMDLKCGAAIDKEACASLTDMVIEEFVRIGKSTGKFTVIDRANRDKILSEQGFQQKGCVESSCTVDAGRLLGVGRLVVGTISKVGETYNVSLQIINVQTAAVDTAASERCKCNLDGLIDTVINVSRKLMGEAPAQATAPATQPAGASGEMVQVPAGEFIMGSTPEQAESGFQVCLKYNSNCKREWFNDEQPVHKVYLDAFKIDKNEVSNEQYQQCVNGGPCSAAHFDDGSCNIWDGSQWKQGALPQSFRGSNQPVVCVDWTQSSTYCTWAGKRLPTEAEWEKAARGTDGRTYPWGEGIDCTKANYKDCGNGKTKPVGSYPSGASPYGAMDMAGNVFGWVADWYDANYYQSGPNRNPTGPASGTKRVCRGGSWLFYTSSLRTSFRSSNAPDVRFNVLGFRCARTP